MPCLAHTAIIIGVNPRKGRGLTSEQLVDMFKGTRTQWKDGNQIIVQAQEKSDSGFLVLENTLPGFKEVYAESHRGQTLDPLFQRSAAQPGARHRTFALGVTDLGMIATERLMIKVSANSTESDPIRKTF